MKGGAPTMKKTVNQYHEIGLTTEDMDIHLMFDAGMYKSGAYSRTLHAHQYYELFYIERGTMHVICKNTEMTLVDRDFVIIPPGMLHRSESDDLSLLRYSFAFTVQEGKYAANNLKRILPIASPISMKGYDRMQEAFLRLRDYQQSDMGEKLRLMASCVYEILYLVRHAYAELAEQSMGHDTDDGFVSSREYREYIIDHSLNKSFTEDITLESLAGKLYISKQQLNHIIKMTYGRTFRQQVIYLRMQNASKLLCETDSKIGDIANSLGYSSIRGFYTVFIKTYGMTPDAYRSAHRQEGGK